MTTTTTTTDYRFGSLAPPIRKCTDCAAHRASSDGVRHSLQERNAEIRDLTLQLSDIKKLREAHAAELANRDAELDTLRKDLAAAHAKSGRRAPRAKPGLGGIRKSTCQGRTQLERDLVELREIKALCAKLKRERACEQETFSRRVWEKLAPLEHQEPEDIPLPESREEDMLDSPEILVDAEMAGLEPWEIALPESREPDSPMSDPEDVVVAQWRQSLESSLADDEDDEDENEDIPAAEAVVGKDDDDIELVMLDSKESSNLDMVASKLEGMTPVDDVAMVDSDDESPGDDGESERLGFEDDGEMVM